MCAPLRDLILQRITSGIYYDLVGGDPALRNEASDRFEEYAARYVAAMLPGFGVERSQPYQFQGNEVHTPDALLRVDGEIAAVFECKATKLTFAAQYADDPVEGARREYSEIAKGVFQVWRFFSHVRRGFLPEVVCRPNSVGVVLTLDAWMVMSGPIKKEIFAAAEALAAEDDDEIIEADRRPTVFCHMADLEAALSMSDENGFLGALVAAATEDRFFGWTLPNVLRELGRVAEKGRPFPFHLGEVLPWWDETDRLMKGAL